ncbi:two-component sensor histidine kinase [Aliidongia dinghuensis]|uniref:histidine kinase n=1 Tax=Aliidongia dinghuensis TaxID=1867774 RepID=A0A8J2Z1C2_9PROT|nr:ATP-binding protein [Aliidongia dinghuensis]GGF49629.1 two-component sensor histidine kinase [Aliidongia dinghuensis]
MRPPRLFRTTSFRLTLIYATVFTASVVVLFAVIYWSTAGFMARQMDVSVDAELTALLDGQPAKGLDHLRQEVDERIRQAPTGFFYLLQNAKGEVLATNLPRRAVALHHVNAPRPKLFEDGTEAHGFHGRGVVTTDNAYLFVANDNFQLEEMQELVARAFALALVLTLVLALGGGALMSAGLLRRVEAVSRASREIVDGDLERRMPVAGTDDEFDHLAASLNTMLDRIQGLMEGLRQVSNDIAHDLRTPLTRLRHRLELARRREGTVEGLNTALDGAIQQVDDILDTFGALLRIAQIEGGARRGTFASVDLSELVQGLAETYQPVAEEKGQRLEHTVTDDLRVRGDRELIVQMLANLIENAIRHAPARATIQVTARRTNGRPEIVVADDGPGIPAVFRDRVFQRFFRLEESRTTPGSGLGLSLVAAVAALHQIEIELGDNRPGLVVTLRF